MQNIYQDSVEEVRNGARFSVNLEKRTFRLNGKDIIKEGAHELPLGVDEMSREDAIEELERLFLIYRHSIPSERSDHAHRYFLPLREDDLNNEDFLFGEPRTSAQCALELFLLCCIINGSIRWEDSSKWYWVSPRHDALVILRGWVE